MVFAFPQYYNSKSRFQTYNVVRNALIRRGHTVHGDMQDCDAVLFSICDATEYPQLVRIAKQSQRPIIAGGAFAYNYKSLSIYADMVWVGEIFGMADCKTIEQIRSSRSCYYQGKDGSVCADMSIRWSELSVCQISKNKAYYWGGAGCKNKCRFCYTSWTHRHQRNSNERIESAKRSAQKSGLHLMISSNEYENADGGKTFDILAKDYLKTPVSGSFVRMGIEFATEDSRRKNGKPISNDDIVRIFRKAAHERISMRLFHIAGYDSIDEWSQYIDLLCGAVGTNNKMLHLMFNNLQYQNYTPLYGERRGIDPSKYIDVTTTRSWYDRLRKYAKSVLVGAPSPFQHVACRMGIELSTQKDQIDFWLSKINNAKQKMTISQAYDSLFGTGVMDTPALRLDFDTGEISERKDVI